MDNKKIRLVLFSTWGSDYREVELKVSTFVSLVIGFVFVLALVGSGLVVGFKFAFQHYYAKYQAHKHERLRTQFFQWKGRTEELALRYGKISESFSQTLLTMAKTNSPIDSAAVLDGRGGAFVDEEDNILPSLNGREENVDGNLYFDKAFRENHPDYMELSWAEVIDHLESRLNDTRKAYEVIFEKFEQRRRQLENTPSIKPIFNGRITDFFGKRVDPFVRRVRHHRGLDIAAERGTEVHAPAAGRVEFVKTRYRINRGYGRVVIINHGYGMKTLYGHLWKIKVKQGQRVERWDTIGLVGDTGRATGPHLHYEVWVDGKARDPAEFIINE